MSFNYYARKVRDPARLIGVRRSALGSCVLRLGWLTGERYLAVRDRIVPCLGCRGKDCPLTEQEMLNALTIIERERNRLLEKQRAFDRRRIRAKLRGKNRFPSKADRAFLYGNTGNDSGA